VETDVSSITLYYKYSEGQLCWHVCW